MHHGKITPNIARALQTLQERIDAAQIPPSKLDETLNLATWNIREFGKSRRRKVSLHLIAEIIGQFDLVALTEVRDNLADLNAVLGLLGPYWKAVFSDFNADRRGNRERIAYVFDKRAVSFTGLAAEAEPPRVMDKATGESISRISWWRSPFMSSFRAGDFDFLLLAAHIRWDSSGGEQSRLRGLQLLADWVDARSREKFVLDKDIIVLGDFNIPAIDNDLFHTVTSKGLLVPEALRGEGHGSNLARDKRYDQILHLPRIRKCFTDNAGVLDFYCGDHRPLMRGHRVGKREFTYELSDHLPLWIQLNTDVDADRLKSIIRRDELRKKK